MKSNELPSFSNWQKWGPDAVKQAPREPGVYIFKLAKNVPRLTGDSDLIYIGCTTSQRRTLQNRLKDHLKGLDDVSQRLERTERQVGGLEVAGKTHTTAEEAKDNEANLLCVYDMEHLELPPLNRSASGKLKWVLIEALRCVSPDKFERLSASERTQWAKGFLDEILKKVRETPRP